MSVRVSSRQCCQFGSVRHLGSSVIFTRRGYSNIQIFLTLIMVCPLVADDAKPFYIRDKT